MTCLRIAQTVALECDPPSPPQYLFSCDTVDKADERIDGGLRHAMPVALEFIERDIWQKHKNDTNFVLIGIDRDEPLEKVLKFAKQTGVTYPLGLDPGADIYAKYALRQSGITRNILIDKDGIIIKRTRLYKEEEFNSLVEAIDNYLKKKK